MGESNSADRLIPHRWQPGQSGNPGGRPPGRTLTAMMKDFLQTEAPNGRPVAELVVEAWVGWAIRGKPTALKELLERHDGKVPRGVPPVPFDLTDLVGDAEKEARDYRPDEPRPADGTGAPEDPPGPLP